MVKIHEETKRELIENGSGLLGTLLKEMIVHRNQIQVMEQQKEKELELARARAEAGSDQPEDDDSGLRSPEQAGITRAPPTESGEMKATPAEIEAAIDELIEEEMCDVCRELLVALKDRPPRDQVRGIMEYGTFKQNLGDGAGVEELKATIRETEVLHDIFQQKYTVQGRQP